MTREVSFMFKNLDEFVQLKAGVLSYLQRDIEKLLKMKDLDAEFVNIATPGKASEDTWLLFKVHYTWYTDANDLFGNYDSIWFAYPIQQNLFTRDHDLMDIVDSQAHISRALVFDKQKRLSDIDLVKLRILYHIFHSIKCIQDNKLSGIPNNKFHFRKCIEAYCADDGSLMYQLKSDLPRGFD